MQWDPVVCLVSLAIGYACGTFLTAEVVSRHVGGKSAFDVGLGNPGMANIGSVYGVKAAAVTLAGDLVKSVVAFVLARVIFSETSDLAGVYAVVGTTLGHVFPAWHRFRGGKGVASTGAAVVLASPIAGFVALVCGLLTVLFGGYLCVGAIVIPAVWLVIQLFVGDAPRVFAGVVLLVIAIYCHGDAIRGIKTGETGRASISEKFLSALYGTRDGRR